MRRRGNGEGSIFQRQLRGKNIWVGEYTLGIQPNGKKKTKTVYGKTRKEVKEKLDKLLIELNTEKYVETNKLTLRIIIKQFIDLEFKLNKLSPISYTRKLNTYNQICKHYLADMPLQKIAEYDIREFFIYITKYSNSVIGKIYGLLNSTFKRAVNRNLIKENPIEAYEFSKPKSSKKDKVIRGFTIEEQKHLITILSTETFIYKYQVLISLYTGMRMGEVNALTIEDIDFEKKLIHVNRTITKDENEKIILGNYTKTKTGTRSIIMNPFIEELFKEYLSTNHLPNKYNVLFYDFRSNKLISTNQVNLAFKRLCKKYNISLGYDVNQHMLRHTFATRCIESGMPAPIVSKIMGHADIKTTLNIYTDVFALYEKKHYNMALEYLQQNNLTLNK